VWWSISTRLTSNSRNRGKFYSFFPSGVTLFSVLLCLCFFFSPFAFNRWPRLTICCPPRRDFASDSLPQPLVFALRQSRRRLRLLPVSSPPPSRLESPLCSQLVKFAFRRVPTHGCLRLLTRAAGFRFRGHRVSPFVPSLRLVRITAPFSKHESCPLPSQTHPPHSSRALRS